MAAPAAAEPDAALPSLAMAAPCAVWFGPEDDKVVCPYDANHQMPKSSLEKHVVSCRLRKLDYSKEEEAEMYDSSVFYEKVNIPTVVMDKDLQFHVMKQARILSAKEGGSYSQGASSLLPVEVPQNHKRFICDLSQADRLALYDYVVEETKKQRSRSQFTENDSDLFVDLAAKISQDARPHIGNRIGIGQYGLPKNQPSVIRDVIAVHMEELSSHWQEESRLDNDAEVCEGGKSSIPAKSSGRKEERRSASVDSRQSCESSKDTDRSRQRRDASRSPEKRRRSRERGKERDSRRKKERDEGKYLSHKRRK
ncbi:U11/U12 small nuclear ribonucleoprotein [Alligator mississippiensis]|uniref:U11/U12 small nuclear ribonucleoprotein n=1 Tax=Alligator mississippiensis TaxID=8496 RepID=A0A151P124_ALLMI|nr:U11/U12 small nuclear ribonucleoprotein [Alligator mississippiensis]